MQGGRRSRWRLAVVAVVALAAPARADDAAFEADVAAVERAASDPDHVFAAARTCEDHLYDPARAAALYERVAREWPDARAAIPAARRAEQLRAQLGPRGEYAVQARELARLIAEVDQREEANIVATADRLSDGWPGASDAALWLAEWLCERGRFGDAQQRYATIHSRWPSSPQGIEALRDAAGCALDAKDWDRALALANELPGGNPVEDAARDELIAHAKQGRRRDTIAVAAWLALALALAVLLASLGDAVWRGGRKWPAVRPPIEAMFLAPIAAVLVAFAYGAQRVIAPAVLRISVAGVLLAWISGTALDTMRARGRSTRARSLVHIAACTLGVLAVAYLAVVHDGLLDMLFETARYGPEP